MDTQLTGIFGGCCGHSCLKRYWTEPYELRQLIRPGASRKIIFGLIRHQCLFLSREANSWDNSHTYGRAIDRRLSVHDDQMLTMFRDNPHPNVMRLNRSCACIIEAEYIDGAVFDGESPYLYEGLRRTALAREMSAEELERVIGQVRSGISHIHSLGYAHTDVAGCNVMIAKDGTAKIVDLLSSVPLTEELESFDWSVFENWFCTPARLKNKEGTGPLRSWHASSEQAEKELQAFLPATGVFVLVDEDRLRHGWSMAGRALPFLASGMEYRGLPENDEQAIRELTRLKSSGACCIAFAWTSFWVLEYYKTFHRYLRDRFSCVLQNERLIVFDLRSPGSGGLSRPVPTAAQKTP